MKHFWRDRRGATAVEYGLIVAMICVGLLVSLASVRNGVVGLLAIPTNAINNSN